MRLACAFLLLLAAALRAEEAPPPLAARMPAGASSYLETRDLAGALDLLWNCPAARQAREHPAVRALWDTPQGKQLRGALAWLKGVTGVEPGDLAKGLFGREAALAVYGPPGPPRVLLLLRVDADAAEAVLGALRLLSAMSGGEAAPPDGALPAVLGFGGKAFGFLDGDLLVLATTLEHALAARAGEGGLAASAPFRAARALARRGETLSAWVDLAPYAAALRPGKKPEDVGQALLLGPAAAYAAAAPVACFGLSVRREGDDVELELAARVPAPDPLPEGIAAAAGGSLTPLPFRLPPTTLAVLRMRRDLGALWAHREELLSERGIAGMVEFETNFGTISAGLSFSDELLPEIRPELTFLATRPVAAPGALLPEVRLPHFALLVPLRDAAKVAPDLKMAFQSAVVFLSAASVQENGRGLRLELAQHGGVDLLTAVYAPPTEAEMEGRTALPMRYNFAPSCAVVGGTFLLGSHPAILRDLVDGHGAGGGGEPGGPNSGLWIEGRESARLLAENREALVAKTVLEKGLPRAAAEARADLLLALARHVASASLEFREGGGEAGLVLRARIGPGSE